MTFVRLTRHTRLDTLAASVEYSTAPPARILNVSFPLMLLALICPDEGRFFSRQYVKELAFRGRVWKRL